MVTPAWGQYVDEASKRYNVPRNIIESIIGVESSGRPGAVSSAGAGGLMQLMPDTFAELRRKHGLGPDRFDPQTNINAGTAYVRQMHDQFGNWNDAFGAYNAGPGRWARVKAGTATAPPETRQYIPRVQAGIKETDVALNRAPVTEDDLLELARSGQMPGQTGLLNVTPNDMSRNYLDGLGLLGNAGQTPSQPPRTDPAALPGTTQTERLDLSSRINELMGGLSQPVDRSQRMGVGGMMMQGALGQVLPLAGERNRKVGIGELLGSLGAGLNQGSAAFQQQQRADRADQFTELGGLVKMDEYQRTQATQAAKVEAARRYAAQLRATGQPDKVAMADAIEKDPSLIDNVIGRQAEYAFPKPPRTSNPPAPPAPVTLGDGPQGPGVYSRNPDGTLGPRLGASETAPGTEIAETLTPEIAQERGLPPPPAASPYSNPNLSPRGRSNLVEAERKRFEKRAADNGEAVKSATSLITDMQRFQYLNSQTDTGGITGSPIGGAVRSLYDTNVKEMNAIRDRITPSLRQPGSGATSDFDARMFQGGTVGVDKPKAVNDNIATATIVAGQNLIAKSQFEQAYFDAYQHTSGMEAAWQKYLNDNPIFDPKAPTGSYQLNQNRVDWQTYWRNSGKAPEPGRPQAPMSGGEGSSVPPPPPGATIIQ